jgi:NADPH-dependent curcumin reductase
MTTVVNRQWCLARRPVGRVKESDFEWREGPVPVPGPRHALVRVRYLSLGSSDRCWMRAEDTYLSAQRLGDVVRGVGIGSVVRSNHPEFPVGSNVMGAFGWQDFAVTDGSQDFFMTLPDDASIPLPIQLALFGPAGIAAYFGVTEIARPREGESMAVSAAGGGVGSLAGQIGRLLGCRVVGIAGSEEKCRWLTEELGFDAAIDYKHESVFRELRKYCPHGLDIFFDGVGGPLLEEALNLINPHARVVVCGMLSAYNDLGGTLSLPPGPNNLVNIAFKRARIEGFVCLDRWHRANDAFCTLLRWHRQGQIRCRAEIISGLRKAPGALDSVFDGVNRGTLVLEI